VGTTGYERASSLTYRPGEVILEVGSGDSTRYLSRVGPLVVTVDADATARNRAAALRNVEAHLGRAEEVLRGWDRPVGFAWLDGHDWPYEGNPPDYYADQRRDYARRRQSLTRRDSRAAHLAVARLIARHARVVAFDDTWRTHRYRPGPLGCSEPVPPATTPAPALAMNEPIDRTYCGLELDHPHHDDHYPWNGKGGTAIPYLRDWGFDVVEYGLGLVVLRRGGDDD
jgi:hypothetical protein